MRLSLYKTRRTPERLHLLCCCSANDAVVYPALVPDGLKGQATGNTSKRGAPRGGGGSFVGSGERRGGRPGVDAVVLRPRELSVCTPGADGDAARGTEAGGRVLSGGVPEALAEAVLLSYGDGAGSAVLPEEGLEPGEGRMSGLVNRSPHEATLIARAARGEAEAFSALVREHSTLVYRIALRMLGANEAPDASQEVWLRVWRSIENFKGESAFTTWLSKIAVNTCLSSREKEARRRDRELPEEFPHLAAPTGGENDPESAALDA